MTFNLITILTASKRILCVVTIWNCFCLFFRCPRDLGPGVLTIWFLVLGANIRKCTATIDILFAYPTSEHKGDEATRFDTICRAGMHMTEVGRPPIPPIPCPFSMQK